jgi:hypothetical protein
MLLRRIDHIGRPQLVIYITVYHSVHGSLAPPRSEWYRRSTYACQRFYLSNIQCVSANSTAIPRSSCALHTEWESHPTLSLFTRTFVSGFRSLFLACYYIIISHPGLACSTLFGLWRGYTASRLPAFLRCIFLLRPLPRIFLRLLPSCLTILAIFLC